MRPTTSPRAITPLHVRSSIFHLTELESLLKTVLVSKASWSSRLSEVAVDLDLDPFSWKDFPSTNGKISNLVSPPNPFVTNSQGTVYLGSQLVKAGKISSHQVCEIFQSNNRSPKIVVGASAWSRTPLSLLKSFPDLTTSLT